jgi:hypothetical protein
MATNTPRTKEDMERAKNLYEKLIDPLTACARAHGYALATHGSLARDIDLIAVPWRSWACAPKELVVAIQATIKRVHGIALLADVLGAANPGYFYEGSPFHAHGRLCWAFHLGGGPYIDLSVMPPTGEYTKEEYAALCGKRTLPMLEEEAAREAHGESPLSAPNEGAAEAEESQPTGAGPESP